MLEPIVCNVGVAEVQSAEAVQRPQMAEPVVADLCTVQRKLLDGRHSRHMDQIGVTGAASFEVDVVDACRTLWVFSHPCADPGQRVDRVSFCPRLNQSAEPLRVLS